MTQCCFLSRGLLEAARLTQPRALASLCKGYQFALVTTNLLPSRGAFAQNSCWAKAASFLSLLVANKRNYKWVAGRTAFWRGFVTETLSSGSWAVKLLPANPRHREDHFLYLKGKHRGLIMSSGDLSLISSSWKLFLRRLGAQLKMSRPVL